MDKTLLKLAIKLIDLGWNVRFDTSSNLVLCIKNIERIELFIRKINKLDFKYSIYDCYGDTRYKVKSIKDLENTLNVAFNTAYKNAIKNDLDLLMAGEIQHIINVQKQKNKPFTTVNTVEEDALLLALIDCPAILEDYQEYEPFKSDGLSYDFKSSYNWANEYDTDCMSVWSDLYAMYDYYMLKLTEESFNNFLQSYLYGPFDELVLEEVEHCEEVIELLYED
jgi:hypothetical protein